MRKIVWTDDAVGHLEAIVTYIAAFDPAAAERLALKLIEVADSPAEFPTAAETQAADFAK